MSLLKTLVPAVVIACSSFAASAEDVHAVVTPLMTKALADFPGKEAHMITVDYPPGSVDPETMLIPVNGTREGLFAFAQAVVDAARAPLVVMPNPFYQIYEGAALLAGAQPHFLGSDRANCL